MIPIAIISLSGGGSSVAQPTPEPQSSNITFSQIADDSITISWNKGGGSNSLVVMKSASAVDDVPVNESSYTANTVFGSGSEIGADNFVVYNGTGSSVTVTGLSDGVTYHVTIFTFEGTTYNTEAFADNMGMRLTMCTEYQAVIDYAVANDFDVPTQDILDSDNGKVMTSLLNGSWADFDILYMFANRASYRDYAKINWKNPSSYYITEVGTLTFDDLGFTGNGTNAYLRTHWTPSINGVGWTQNNAGAVIQLGKSVNAAESAFGANASSNTLRTVFIPRSSGNASYIINGTSSDTYAHSNSSGFWHLKRTASNAVAIFKSGASVDTASVASTGTTNQEMYLLAANNNGTAASFSTNAIKFIAFGASQTGRESDIYNTWTADLDQSLGFVPDNIYYVRLSGQSNAEGITTVASLDSGLRRRFNNVYIWYNPTETSTGGRWEKLWAGVNNQRASRLQYYGSEIAIADLFETNHPTDVLYISKYAQGSTDMSYWTSSGDAYEKARDCYHNPSYAAVDALYTDPIEDLGMIWMQGESDAMQSKTASTYTSQVSGMLTNFRTALSAASMVAYVCRLNDESAAPRPSGANIRNAQSTATNMICDPALRPLNIFFDTDAYALIDAAHFEQLPFGEDLYNVLFP